MRISIFMCLCLRLHSGFAVCLGKQKSLLVNNIFHVLMFLWLFQPLQNSANIKLLPLIRGNGRSQCEDHWIR